MPKLLRPSRARHPSFAPTISTYRLSLDTSRAQSALTSAFDVDAFFLSLLSRSRLCASIQSSSTLPSIIVVSGKTKLSTRSLQNSLWPIWVCKQHQHCEFGTTCGGAVEIGHLRPEASDSAHLVVRAAVRAWPQEWVVACVEWHISLDERKLHFNCWRDVSPVLL